jgi:hypothetical protein
VLGRSLAMLFWALVQGRPLNGAYLTGNQKLGVPGVGYKLEISALRMCRLD